MKSITDRASELANAAAAQAVELAKGTSFIGSDGQLVQAPTAAEALMAFQAYAQQVAAVQQALQNELATQQGVLNTQAEQLVQQAALLDQQSQLIGQQQAALAVLPQTLAAAISANNAQFVTPAVQGLFQTITGASSPQGLYTLQEVMQHLANDETGAAQLLAQQNLLAGRVTTAEAALLSQAAALGTKALAADVTALQTTVATTTAALSTKASASDLTTLAGTVNTKAAAADLASLTTVVAGKALASDLTTANSNLSALTATVGAIPAAITQAKQDVKADLLGGAGAAYDTLQELATLELNSQSVTQALALRVGTVESLVNNPTTGVAALNTGLATKALASDVTTLASTVGTKAAQADLATLTTTVGTKAAATDLSALQSSTTTALATKASASDVTNLTTTVNGKASTAALATVQSAVTQNTTDIGNRLRKDQADTTTFPLNVPVSAAMTQAVQKSELVGGIQRPYRLFQNVGATAVGAYVRTGQSAQIIDSLGLGQVYALTVVRIKTLTAPTLASTIKVLSGATEVFSTQVALTTLPAVGKTLDLLSLSSSSLPADITLPATLTCSASSGTFEIIVDGVLK